MPKPVKKAAKKQPATKKRPASDPNLRSKQLMDEHLEQLAAGKWGDPATHQSDVTPPHGDPFEEQFRKRMAELGRKGGKASGARRMEMPEKQRKEIAKKAAKVRWSKRDT